MDYTTEVSLTRKLRLLINMPEMALTPAEAELFDIGSIDDAYQVMADWEGDENNE
ncbi:hypothetical protein [Mucilaginibacter limnophilus]|uniref:hypothetical protein n=1 Tax=Mucilaginibacter limnophilus TaxID=1932778 RepID=UPI0013E2B990|nr:hypothetical protein [Mucilaginibacter limnophilus]